MNEMIIINSLIRRYIINYEHFSIETTFSESEIKKKILIIKEIKLALN